MKKNHKKLSKKTGLKPGSVFYIGKEQTETVKIELIEYNKTELKATFLAHAEECKTILDSHNLSWINFDGIHDTAVVEKIGEIFNIHSLILEDIVNTSHRPSFEDHPRYIFLSLKIIHGFTDDNNLESEQVSFILGNKWLLSFQETGKDVFMTVRNRLRGSNPQTRFMQIDYLVYALVDAVVDHYFVVLESIEDRIEDLDEQLIDNPKHEHLDKIKKIKKEIIGMRKAVLPLREAIGRLIQSDSDLINESTRPFLKDLYDHIINVIDTLETYRDMVAGLLDLYHTGIANKMNEVMKILTVFAAIFIPLGFLAGVYGMNFDTQASHYNLPELGLKFGYPLFWATVLIIVSGLLWFFHRKKWF